MLLPSHQRQNKNLALEGDGNGCQPLSCLMMNNDDPDDPSIPPHPLGVKPLGNKYFSEGEDARKFLGALQVLPDEMLMHLLEFLDKRALRLLGYTCRFLFACCVFDEIWKTIFLE